MWSYLITYVAVEIQRVKAMQVVRELYVLLTSHDRFELAPIFKFGCMLQYTNNLSTLLHSTGIYVSM